FLLGGSVEVDPDRLHMRQGRVALDLFLEKPAVGQREHVQHVRSGEQDPLPERMITKKRGCPRTGGEDAVTKLSHRPNVAPNGASSGESRGLGWVARLATTIS